MAVSTINPWAAGAVVFDTRPFQAFYERQMAHQQARQDALDNYFRDLGKNVTSAGMRSQDIPGLLSRQQQWQQFYQQNKSAILNPKIDGGQAYSNYMRGYQDQLAHINESKERQKTSEELGKLRFNKDSGYVFDDPNVENDIEAHNLPIDDPRSKKLDMASMVTPPRPIDVKDRETYQKYLIGGLKPDAIAGAPINVGNYQIQTPVTHSFSDKNLKVIGDRAMDMYDTDKRWRVDANNIMKDIMHDPTRHQQLNSLYNRIYGKDIETPREARAAQDMASNMASSIEYKPGQDVYGRELAMAGVRHGYRMTEMQAAAKLRNKSGQYQDKVIEDLYNQVKNDARKPENTLPYKTAEGKVTKTYQMKAAGAIRKMFAVPDEHGHLMYPDAVRYSDDFKTVTPIFYEYYPKDYGDATKAGRPKKDPKTGMTAVDNTLSQPVLESEFKQRWKKQLMGTSAYDKTILTKGGSDDDGGGSENESDPLGLGF